MLHVRVKYVRSLRGLLGAQTELDNPSTALRSDPLVVLPEAARYVELNNLCHPRSLSPILIRLLPVPVPLPAALAADGVGKFQFLQERFAESTGSHPHISSPVDWTCGRRLATSHTCHLIVKKLSTDSGDGIFRGGDSFGCCVPDVATNVVRSSAVESIRLEDCLAGATCTACRADSLSHRLADCSRRV